MAKCIPDVVWHVKNAPITDARVTKATSTGNGTFIYYTQDGDPYTNILDADVLVDIIKATGIIKGGKIPCELIKIALHSSGNFRLVRVGSKDYNEAVKIDKLRERRAIRIKDLKVGGVYKSLRGSTGIYLGEVTIQSLWTESVLIVPNRTTKGMLWLEISRGVDILNTKSFQLLLLNLDRNVITFTNFRKHYNITVKRTHSYRIHIDDILVTTAQAIKTIQDRITNTIRFHGILPRMFNLFIMELATLALDNTTSVLVTGRMKQLVALLGRVYMSPDFTLEELPPYLVHDDTSVRWYAKMLYNHLTVNSPMETFPRV